MPGVDWQTLSQFVETAVGNGETDVYRRAREHFDRLLIARAMQACERLSEPGRGDPRPQPRHPAGSTAKSRTCRGKSVGQTRRSDATRRRESPGLKLPRTRMRHPES